MRRMLQPVGRKHLTVSEEAGREPWCILVSLLLVLLGSQATLLVFKTDIVSTKTPSEVLGAKGVSQWQDSPHERVIKASTHIMSNWRSNNMYQGLKMVIRTHLYGSRLS